MLTGARNRKLIVTGIETTITVTLSRQITRRRSRAALEAVEAARGNRIPGRGPRPALHRRRRHRHEEADLRDEENQERSEAVVRHGCPRSIGLQSPGNAADVPTLYNKNEPPIVKLGLLL